MARIKQFNTNRKMPGITGKRVPGSARLPAMTQTGGLFTRVPRQPTSSQFRERHRMQIRDVSGRFAGGWGIAWQGLESTADAMFDYSEEFREQYRRRIEDLKNEMVAWAKANAPWKDDPTNATNARESLQGVVVEEGGGRFVIFLGHGDEIYYGVFLEVRWGGRYAILVPTLWHFFGAMGSDTQFRILT